MIYLENLIQEEYKTWGREGPSTIFFDASTGTGKTTFILKRLHAYAREQGRTIKIYVPRLTLRDLYEEWKEDCAVEKSIDLLKIDSEIVVETYQSIAEKVKHGQEIEYADYLVFDEVHCFLSDSLFNTDTNLVFSYVLNQKKSNVRIFMSATGERIFSKIINENALNDFEEEHPGRALPVHVSQKEFKRYILHRNIKYNIKYYDAKLSRKDVIKSNLSGKWVVYVTNKDVGEKLRDELLHDGIYATFISRQKRQIESETFYSISALERFSAQVLITTAVVETGVNFRDDIANVMVEANFREQFLQMLGRRRYVEGAEINLYIPQRNERYFSILLGEYQKLHEVYQIIRENGEDKIPQLLEKGVLDFAIASKILYVHKGVFKVNMLSVEEMIYCKSILKKRLMAMEKDNMAFVKEQLSWLGELESFTEANSFKENIRQGAIAALKNTIYECVVEKKNFDNNAKIQWLRGLIPFVKEIDGKLVIKGGFSEGSFNKLCEQLGLGFRMESSNRNPERKTYFWIAEKPAVAKENKEGVIED